MSLIDIKHVAAPLNNKVYLVTILLVAILFLGFRLAGGSAHVTHGAAPIRPAQIERAPELLPPQAHVESGRREASDPAALLAATPSSREAPRRQPSNGLEDIERQLGLR